MYVLMRNEMTFWTAGQDFGQCSCFCWDIAKLTALLRTPLWFELTDMDGMKACHTNQPVSNYVSQETPQVALYQVHRQIQGKHRLHVQV